jgi:hypothetical protein
MSAVPAPRRHPRATPARPTEETSVQLRTLEAYGNAVMPGAADDFTRFIARQTEIYTQSAALSADLAAQRVALPTGVVSSLNDAELFWRSIESEFGLLTSIEVAARLGARANRSYASELRSAGRLLGIRRVNRYVFPGFQFQDGALRPVIASVAALGRENGKDDRDVIAWLCRPTTYIRGDARRPVDHLDDEDLVLDVARRAWTVAW